MKKFAWLVCILFLIATLFADPNASQITSCYEELAYCEIPCGTFGRSFIYTRPIYFNIATQYQLWHDFIFNLEECTNVSIQAMPMYEQSFKNSGVTKYFLFDEKTFLSVKGDDVVQSEFDRDIRAEWLQLPSDFQGGFTVEPKQTQIGLWLEGKVNLKHLFNEQFFRHFWVGVAAPFQVVENEIFIEEAPPTNPAATFPQNISEALSNPTLLYAKFNNKWRLASFAEINLRFGTNFLDWDGFQIGTYSMAVIPTSKANDPQFVFSPYLGNNGHVGFGQAVTFQLPLNCDTECKLISFFLYAQNIYFIRNFQKRTLDLKEKPWSRYLLLVNKDGRRNVPATQVLTQEARVRPFNNADVAMGLRFQKGGLEVDLSYNMWLRGRQEVSLRECFPKDEWGIQGSNATTPDGAPATASKSTIQFQAEDDREESFYFEIDDPQLVFVPIRVSDFELRSGAARGSINIRGQASVGYLMCTPRGSEMLFGIGGFIEAPLYDTDFFRWGAWGKIGFSI